MTADGLDVEAIHAFAGGDNRPGAEPYVWPSNADIDMVNNAGGPIPAGNKGVDMNAVKQAEIDRLTSGRKEKN